MDIIDAGRPILLKTGSCGLHMGTKNILCNKIEAEKFFKNMQFCF